MTSGKRWRLVLLYRIGFKQFSEVRNCTRFLFAFSKVLRKRIVLLMPRQRDSRASFGRTETFVRHSTRFDHLSQRASEDFTEPARETSSLKRKTFTKWYFTHALFKKIALLAPSMRWFESYQEAHRDAPGWSCEWSAGSYFHRCVVLLLSAV